jgi:6-phosphogluconolactonase
MRQSSKQRTRWQAVEDADALPRLACGLVVEAAAAAIAARGCFRIVLAGGDTPRETYRLLRGATTDWSAWQVYFGDERCLPIDDPGRNSVMAEAEWLGHVMLPSARIHAIPAELGAREAARRYCEVLSEVGDFDLVLLGLGDDGHTASLFAGHDWGEGPGAPDALAVLDSPKPPRERVSLSAARLSRARSVLFMITGDSKRPAVNAWRSGMPLPAAAIVPRGGVDVLVESGLLQAQGDRA